MIANKKSGHITIHNNNTYKNTDIVSTTKTTKTNNNINNNNNNNIVIVVIIVRVTSDHCQHQPQHHPHSNHLSVHMEMRLGLCQRTQLQTWIGLRKHWKLPMRSYSHSRIRWLYRGDSISGYPNNGWFNNGNASINV